MNNTFNFKQIWGAALLWSIMLFTYGQRSKVTSGAMAVQDQEYEKAIQYLQEAIAKPELLDQKDLAKAHAKLGQAYIGILTSGKKELIMKYPNILNDAYNAFENAQKYDTDKKFANDIKMGYAVLGPVYYQTAFELYKQKMYKPALEMIEKSIKIFEEQKNRNIYGVFLLEGYCHVGSGDSTKAISSLDKALKAHNQNPPKEPDPAIPSAYALLGRLYAAANDYENMNRIFTEGKTKYPDNEEIRKNEIYMYATNPALYDRALAKFEQDIQKNPDDELLKMAYAQLLESKDMQKAIKIYESILEKNPNNKDVLFNLGALYNNAGKEKYDKANKSSDDNEHKKLLDEAKADFKNALTYIEKSYQLSENASVQDKKAMLKALVQICTLLEENEKLKTYKAALDALK
jgi:tetratricopeptide (TPR) repeat protein